MKLVVRFALVCSLLMSVVAWAEDPAPTPVPATEKVDLPKCPVSGETADLSISAVTDQGPVFFCCANCVKKFEGDKAKFADKVKEQRVVSDKLPKVQTVCPVCGEPANKKNTFDKDGKPYLACSEKCLADFQQNFDKYKVSVLNSFTYQAICPVMGKPINPAVFTKLATNDQVFFCCQRCVKAFGENPSKFAPNLEKQGLGRLAKRASGSEE